MLKYSKPLPVHPHGYWVDIFGHTEPDLPLAAALALFFCGKSVADFGCGPGAYTTIMQECGIDADGYDANPSYPNCHLLDLAVPVTLPRVYDWVLALEVGEHIPKEHEQTFLANIHIHNKEGVVISWAVPGQGGRGHFNEQSNEYIEMQFLQRGYKQLHAVQQVLRTVATYFWFKNTIMVFKNGLHHPLSSKHQGS